MTSRSVEDDHAANLRKLILDSGLECSRVLLDESSASVQLPEEEIGIEEYIPEEYHAEQEEEESVAEDVIVPEEKPSVFPTPSLRRVLPRDVRATLQENTIHVLPKSFNSKIDPDAIPQITTTPKKIYIDTLAGIVGCTEYTRSLAEYWFLDTLANLLRRAQADGLDKPTQALLILWFCEWMKEMQHFDATTRERMMRRFQEEKAILRLGSATHCLIIAISINNVMGLDATYHQENMLAAATYVGETSCIPTPAEVSIDYKAPEEHLEVELKPSKGSSIKISFNFNATSYECSLLDLSKILHYIFDLFSTDYQYDLIRSIFTFPPDYIHIDFPYQIQTPKRLYQTLKPKKPTKKEKSSAKLEKSPKMEKQFEGHDAIMELKTKQQKETEEQEERDREVWNVRNSILPLNMAVTEALYNKYWPPPPPPEPDTEETEKKEKKKGKKKKK